MTEDERISMQVLGTLRAYEGQTLSNETIALLTLEVGFAGFAFTHFDIPALVFGAFVGTWFIGWYLVYRRGALCFNLMYHYEATMAQLESRMERSAPNILPVKIFSESNMTALRESFEGEESFKRLFRVSVFIGFVVSVTSIVHWAAQQYLFYDTLSVIRELVRGGT